MNWVDTITDWQTSRVDDGYAGLHDLADAGFSGGVSTGDSWLLFVNGTAVSVTDHGDGSPTPADIERFDDAALTAYESPHPSLPLLAAMQFGDTEERGTYYTEETPLSEVENTLEDGGFIGYVELSENVLSGDYYTVYQAGRSMHAAFVGSSESLRTDDDAREAAHGEVGLYEVVAASIDVVEIPDAEPGPEPTTAGTPSSDKRDDVESVGENFTESEPSPDRSDDSPMEASVTGDTRTEVYTDPDAGSATADADHDATSTTPDPSEASTDDDTEQTTGVEADAVTEPEPADPVDPADESPTDESPTDETPGEETPPTSATSRVTESDEEPGGDDAAPPSEDVEVPNAPSSSVSTTERGSPTERASATEQLAARSIPSVDPERTGGGSSTQSPRSSRMPRQRTQRDQPPTQQPTRQQEPSQPDSEELDAVRAELETVQESLETVETERDEAHAQLETAREELETAETAREELEAERDDLKREVESLRTRVEELESQLGDVATDGASLSAPEAFDGTNLFVRYESKGKTTVETAHDGDGSPAELAENLRIVHHTQFETEGATVEGEPFGQWLYGTQQYRFAEWLVGQLVFEIRETDATSELSELYDALPGIDRIELSGSVAVPEGDEEMDIGFDIVCRDRMGDPLFVADLDASRQPVSDGQMASLVQDSGLVCESESTFAGAFFVSAAFFEPGALETARDATSGSLLSRDSRLSYVKQSRKRGYHLALVESRDDGFHLSVPDL
ncbi:hypothetical protein DM867_06990 [Halosegnis rubeus]|jgi:archaellum component FlaC|uniref:DUF7527 domain-containing protein n=1 Tax=Halosegnis rubeus TaxID=2212850 RepID=A0A5N5UHE2_9EURY|nr:hypothetical protein [Halosegnis rubeus]KAB7514847.1 hypothetical protein DM867_06990 [Halosegnis rubeus]KAB7518159.1 hypothetical protein DMP03_02010 [Halosegnis rubeus]